jgi:peptide/nickel transport system permease protein
MFQRVINAGRMTMTIGAVAVIISSIIGIIVGCVSGYFGGKVDMVLMRVTEGFSAIPFLPFAMTLSAVMSQMTISENMRIFIIMCILGVLSWTGLARLVRGQVLATRENEYVVAAQAMGVKSSKIAFKHILPNVISVILVTLTLDFATCMLTESSLSYLGFGVHYPRPTWGNMLNGANNSTIIANYWWQWLFPALFLAITTICINIVGDTMRDVMDPKSSVDK